MGISFDPESDSDDICERMAHSREKLLTLLPKPANVMKKFVGHQSENWPNHAYSQKKN